MSSTGESTVAGGLCPTRTTGARPPRARAGGPHPQPEAAPSGAVGYRGPTACAAAGITYRQLDYWDRTGLVEPTVRAAPGVGAHRLYGFRDVLILRVVRRLLDAGVSLQNIRVAVAHLRARPEGDLPAITLMSDGATVYECTSPDEVVALLQGGAGMFGIAVGVVCRDVREALERLHGESVETGLAAVPAGGPVDELARRRRRNRAG